MSSNFNFNSTHSEWECVSFPSSDSISSDWNFLTGSDSTAVIREKKYTKVEYNTASFHSNDQNSSPVCENEIFAIEAEITSLPSLSEIVEVPSCIISPCNSILELSESKLDEVSDDNSVEFHNETEKAPEFLGIIEPNSQHIFSEELKLCWKNALNEYIKSKNGETTSTDSQTSIDMEIKSNIPWLNSSISEVVSTKQTTCLVNEIWEIGEDFFPPNWWMT